MWSKKTIAMIDINSRYFRLWLLIPIILLGVANCMSDDKKRTGGPFYFESVEMKQKSDFPLRPVRQISAEDAKKLNAYGVAYYDKSGRIISYTTFLNGKEDGASKYYYHPQGYLEKEEYLSPEKEIIYLYYDSNGNLLKEIKKGAP